MADNQLDHGPLHEAVAHWDLTVVEFLVQHGATVNAVDKEGRTPLHIAAYVNHVDVVIFLLDHGGEWVSYVVQFLYISLLFLSPPSLSFSAADAECKTFNEEQTAVHYAVRASSLEALRVLIERGGTGSTKHSSMQ